MNRKQEWAMVRRHLEQSTREHLLAFIETQQEVVEDLHDLIDDLVRTLEPYRRPEALKAKRRRRPRPGSDEE